MIKVSRKRLMLDNMVQIISVVLAFAVFFITGGGLYFYIAAAVAIIASLVAGSDRDKFLVCPYCDQHITTVGNKLRIYRGKIPTTCPYCKEKLEIVYED